MSDTLIGFGSMGVFGAPGTNTLQLVGGSKSRLTGRTVVQEPSRSEMVSQTITQGADPTTTIIPIVGETTTSRPPQEIDLSTMDPTYSDPPRGEQPADQGIPIDTYYDDLVSGGTPQAEQEEGLSNEVIAVGLVAVGVVGYLIWNNSQKKR